MKAVAIIYADNLEGIALVNDDEADDVVARLKALDTDGELTVKAADFNSVADLLEYVKEG